MSILVFNAGSATLKFALFELADAAPVLRGSVERFGPAARIQLDAGGEVTDAPLAANDAAQAAAHVLERVGIQPTIVAHRFVHGGNGRAPWRLTAESLAALEGAVPLAPLHMAPALAVVRRVADALPQATAFAVFDTAYFDALPAPAREYALPRDLVRQQGLRRYGFHGLAHRSLYEQWRAATGRGPGQHRIITLQLGQGCSAAAIADGCPVDTSMGFTPLEGLVMGTRPGDLDAGLVLALLRRGVALEGLESLLQQHSGLRGLSGVSGDMRELLELEHDGHAGAQLAIGVFCHRVRKYIGAYLAVLGGADAIVFGGGIGEHAPEIRRRCLLGFEWAGLRLDAARNRSPGTGPISSRGSAPEAWVLHTDEERIIAAEAQAAATGVTP